MGDTHEGHNHDGDGHDELSPEAAPGNADPTESGSDDASAAPGDATGAAVGADLEDPDEKDQQQVQ